jgi:hypothetical protein
LDKTEWMRIDMNMMTGNISRILEALPQLSRQELEAIKSRCTYLLQFNKKQETMEDEDWLLRGLLCELRRRGLDNRASFSVRKSSTSFVTQSERIRKLLIDAVPDMTLTERRLLGEIIGEALANYLVSIRQEVSLTSMLRHVGKVPQAMDHSFPDYIATGMLRLVIQTRTVDEHSVRPATVVPTRVHSHLRSISGRQQ